MQWRGQQKLQDHQLLLRSIVWPSMWREPEDRVNVAMADSNAVFAVASPRGIGGATIERKGKTWPQAVVLRLHLHGLESLRLSKKGKEDDQLTKDSRFWTPVRAFDASGKAVTDMPDTGWYFELAVPQALLGEAKAMKTECIDFYRG